MLKTLRFVITWALVLLVVAGLVQLGVPGRVLAALHSAVNLF